MTKGLGLMNPPVLARLQCQDNGQRQAGFHRKRSRLHGFSQTLFPGCWAPHPVEIKSFGLGHGAKVAIAAGHGLGVPGRASLSTGELGRTPSTLQEPWKAVPPGKQASWEGKQSASMWCRRTKRAAEGTQGPSGPGKGCSDTRKSSGEEKAWCWVITKRIHQPGYTEPRASQPGSRPAPTVLLLDQVSHSLLWAATALTRLPHPALT